MIGRLENGDTVLRDMIDGDPVNFNRQPSLMVSNISTHRAVVTLDPNIKTLLMNVTSCALYNADFNSSESNRRLPMKFMQILHGINSVNAYMI